MGKAVTTLIYKNNDKQIESLDNYRPITTCSALYKIMTRTLATAMLREIHYVIDLNQCGFQLLKETGHSTHLTQCIAQHCQTTNDTGILLFSDHSKAYDRVNHRFLRSVLLTTYAVPA